MPPRNLGSPLAATILACVLAGSPLAAQNPPTAVFRTSRDVVSIDVVVRDRNGALVRGLTADDFELREDGRVQDILTTSLETVNDGAPPASEHALLQSLGTVGRAAAPSEQPDLSGRRVVLMLFDVSEMEPEEVERAVDAARRYVDVRMSAADVVAVASLSWEMRVLVDFTGDRERVRAALDSLVAVDVSLPAAAPTEVSVDGAGGDTSAATGPVVATDARLRALRLLADALAGIPQKKVLLYFSAGLGNGSQDTPAELRAATMAATRANLAVYPVDARGLRAVIPSGPARIGSQAGQGLFSGRDLNDQFTELTASQDTMASLATATGGRLFSGDNDLGAAFEQVQRDTAAYYLLGYSSSNAVRDGRFRKVGVRVKRPGLRVEARKGYYADRDFAHTTSADRELQLEAGLSETDSSVARTLRLAATWSALGTERYVLSFALRSAALPTPDGAAMSADVLAVVEDEQGRVIARVRDTVRTVRSDGTEAWSYVSRAELPPGRYTIRGVARNNRDGSMTGGQTTASVPSGKGLAVSPPIVAAGTAGLPLAGAQLSASHDYPFAFDLRTSRGTPPDASVAFYRDGARVLEARVSGLAAVPDAARGVARFSLVLPAGALRPGDYTYQVTVVDDVTADFTITRDSFTVR